MEQAEWVILPQAIHMIANGQVDELSGDLYRKDKIPE